MPRRRGVARKSFARRRVRRVKKWSHIVVPLRYKMYLPCMAELLEKNLPPPVDCEIPTMELLELEGVPTAEWPYYLGFMKRMLELYQKFTDATLQSEKTSLIEEYVLRGKDRTILESVQLVTEECAGVSMPCWEGNYTTWTMIWGDGVDDGNAEGVGFIDVNGNKIYLRIANQYTTCDLDVGNCVTAEDGCTFYSYGPTMDASICRRYVVFVDCDTPQTVHVWKNGSEITTLTVPDSQRVMTIVVSPCGKYIVLVTIVGNVFCYEGS